jgi:hypothetical protein
LGDSAAHSHRYKTTSSNPRGNKLYFDNATLTPIVAEYRPIKQKRDEALARVQYLRESEDRRRRRRLRDGGKNADENLDRAERHYFPLEAEYQRLANKLAASVYEVAANFAKRYKPLAKAEHSNIELDDLIQAATIYTTSRLHKFDPSLGTSLFSFVTACIRYAWLPILRKERTSKANELRYSTHRADELLSRMYDEPKQYEDETDYALAV